MKQSFIPLIKNAFCITSSVTSAMLVMSETPVAICSFALMDLEARPRQYAKTMILNAQVGFQMTFAILLMCLKNTITSLFVLLTGCFSINSYDRV